MSLLDEFEAAIKQGLATQPDYKTHQFHVDADLMIVCAYLDTLADKDQIQTFMLLPLLDLHFNDEMAAEQKHARIRDRLSGVSFTAEAAIDKLIASLMEGRSVVLVSSDPQAYICDVAKFKHRAIEEPKSEKTVRGPGEGFNEDIMTNVSLIRNRIKSSDLQFESYEIGQATRTKVLLAYMKGKASEARIQTYRDRLSAISTEAIFESANIEEWIEDKELTPFPRLLNTERPDVVSAHLIEGKIAILTDGTPSCLIVPVTFFQFFVSAEDYYQRSMYATLFRWLRMLSFLLSVYTPCLYIALTNYRQEMIPSSLLINLSAQREGVPFPSLVEALIMLIMFELLREAGIRMPTVMGQAISIVGAVVLGQAAVEAGLVSAAMVIVVGITAIANFVSPSFNFGMGQRIIQFVYMLLAVCLGLFGVFCGTLLLVVHLVSIKTTGEPYLSPLAPVVPSRFKDTLLRAPWDKMKKPKR
ncbi:GerA spore germination protein [Paenibacillus curdlanolyticus YK9]|uniref:GerA spore germination protein n=1 Tax=Paenibacillus curdlanolyticus YK9 TaxID=717606 RepID=E0I610_9BACL|nr:spore germination protein [Paenibacillus curdlanolyticus]EFM12402.1 GerA spore germination protein [Paenibacillus curdlanolyticus YK9]